MLTELRGGVVPLRARVFSHRKSRWPCAPRSVQRALTRPWDASGAPARRLRAHHPTRRTCRWPMPKYHHHRCHLTNVTRPQELRTIKVSLKSQTPVCVCPRRPGERHPGSTGIVRSRQKCFTEARLGVFRRSWSLQVRVDKRDLLCSSTPPCPASEARQMERGTSRARASEPSKASASSRPISKAPKASSTSVSTAQRRAGARKIRRKGSVARRLPGSVPACASGAPEELL